MSAWGERNRKKYAYEYLFGLYHQDEGEIFIHGKKAAIANPNDAYELGIGMVHQHFMLVNQLRFWKISLWKRAGRAVP